MIFGKKSNGFSLIEVMIAIGILSIIIAGTTSYMTMQHREIKSLTEMLAKLDVEKFLIAALADGSVCSGELTNSALNPSAPYRINSTSAATLADTSISLNEIYSGSLPTSPVLIRRGQPPSPMTNSLLIEDIRFGNLQATGVGNQYLAQFTISFNGNLVRQLKPLILKKTITLNNADPIASRTITGCLSTSSSFPALNSGLMGSYCTPSTYCGRTSGLALCMTQACVGCGIMTSSSSILYETVFFIGSSYRTGLTNCTAGLFWLN